MLTKWLRHESEGKEEIPENEYPADVPPEKEGAICCDELGDGVA